MAERKKGKKKGKEVSSEKCMDVINSFIQFLHIFVVRFLRRTLCARSL